MMANNGVNLDAERHFALLLRSPVNLFIEQLLSGYSLEILLIVSFWPI